MNVVFITLTCIYIELGDEKIAISCADFNRKLATELCSKYDAVCIESLSLNGMSRALRLSRSVSVLCYAEFVSKLRHKSEETGTHVIQADQWFASTKLCNKCGYKNRDLRFHERTWTCPNCGAEHSRDENAGKNLCNVGLDILGLGKPSEPVEKIISRIDFGSYAVFCEAGSPSAFTDG